MADETNPFSSIEAPSFRGPTGSISGFVGQLMGQPSAQEFQGGLDAKRAAYDVQQEQQQRQAQSEVMSRIAKLQSDQPNASPQDITRQIMMDPVFLKSAGSIKAGDHSKFISDIVQASNKPAAQFRTLAPGVMGQPVDPFTQQPTGAAVLNNDNKDIQTMEYLRRVDEANRTGGRIDTESLMQLYHDFKKEPTDKEKAFRLLERTGLMSKADITDYNAGFIHVSPVTTNGRDAYNNVTSTTNGYQMVNSRTKATSYMPLPPNAAGLGEAFEAVRTGQPTTPTNPGTPVVPPSSQPPERGDTVPGANPGVPQPYPHLPRIGAGTEHDQPSTEMFNAAGLARRAVDMAGDVIGQIPGQKPPRPAESHQQRALEAWKSAVVAANENKHLKGEFQTTMARLPSDDDNAYTAADKALASRREMEGKLDAWRAAIKGRDLAPATKQKLSDQIATTENVLRLLPPTDDIIAYMAERTKKGQPGMGVLPSVSEAAKSAVKAGAEAGSQVTGPGAAEPTAPAAGQPTPAPAPAPAPAPKVRTPEQKETIRRMLENQDEKLLPAMIQASRNDPDMMAALHAEVTRRERARSNAVPKPGAPKPSAPAQLSVPQSR